MELELTYTPQQLDIFFPKDPVKYTIVAKGRRFGATRGAAHACIEWAAEGKYILWGDVINANISRYWDRYFVPALKSTGLSYSFDSQKNLAKIGPGTIDFRSAERPETWEGFGYHIIILNEAGIILQDADLYTKSVLPMLLDYPGSRLFALGVPKGRRIRGGAEAPFFKLFNSEGPDRRSLRFSSYDNKLLREEDVRELEAEMAGQDHMAVRQEIWGEFIDRANGEPFAFSFDMERHVRATTPSAVDLQHFSIDFNVEPFVCIHARLWTDAKGDHCHVHRELVVREASITAMAQRILAVCPHRQLIRITGDRNGMSRRIGANDSIPLFEELRRHLGISASQVEVPPNPTHALSREETNFVLAFHPDFAIDPACTKLISDLQTVAVDETGSILKADRSKSAQQADALDCLRYLIGTRLRTWIKRKRNELRIDSNGRAGKPVRNAADLAYWRDRAGL